MASRMPNATPPRRQSKKPVSATTRQAQCHKGRAASIITSPRKLKCSRCDRSFSHAPELSQHQRDKHGTNTNVRKSDTLNCSLCSRSFSISNELNQHKRDKHQIVPPRTVPSANKLASKISPSIQRHSCARCERKFATKNDLQQHTVEKHKHVLPGKTVQAPAPKANSPIHGSFSCHQCQRSFSAKNYLMQHQRDTHDKKQSSSNHTLFPPTENKASVAGNHKCKTCQKDFPTYAQLRQHQEDKHRTDDSSKQKTTRHLQGASERKHPNSVQTEPRSRSVISHKEKQDNLRTVRKKNIDDFYVARVNVDNNEKKASVKIVDTTLSQIMSHVNRQRGGAIYCPNHVKAGSYPVNTKIGKADEFDTNICLKLGSKDVRVRREGKIQYKYTESAHSTNMNVKCQLDETKKGPKIPDGNAVASVCGATIPESLRHGNDLLPREMRYDLYQKIKTAIHELHLNHVDLSRDAHGPALTLTIHPHRRATIRHDISVDMTLSVPCDEPITNWPRKETKKAFSNKLINDVKEAGTHLVPKKDEFWSVSYSRAERELFSKIDEGNGCRKFVYKMLKKHLQTCKSRSSCGLPGLSSHILKTQLLWSCEKHTADGYWNQDNRDLCLIDTMTDLEMTLKNGHLSDYFNKNVDLLKGKDSAALNELANHLNLEKHAFDRQ